MNIKTAEKPAKAVALTTAALRDVVYTPLEQISLHQDLPMRKLNKEFVSELVLDISKNGLDTPLFLWAGEKEGTKVKNSKGEVYDCAYLIAGNHRLAALKQIKKTDPTRFDALFAKGIPSIRRICAKADALCLQLRENVQRNDMLPEQILPILTLLTDTYKLKGKDIAARVGKSTAWVSMILEIKEQLGDEGADEVAKGNVSMRDARAAAKELKSERKEGKNPDVKEKLKSVKSKTAAKRKGNKHRAERKVGLKDLYERVVNIPKLTQGRKCQLLEDIILYTLGKNDTFPEELNAKDENDEGEE